MFPESNVRAVPYGFHEPRTPSFSHIPQDGFRSPWFMWPSQMPRCRLPRLKPQPLEPFSSLSSIPSHRSVRPRRKLSQKAAKRGERPLPDPSALSASAFRTSSPDIPPPASPKVSFFWSQMSLPGRAMLRPAHETTPMLPLHPILYRAEEKHGHAPSAHAPPPLMLPTPPEDTRHGSTPHVRSAPPVLQSRSRVRRSTRHKSRNSTLNPEHNIAVSATVMPTLPSPSSKRKNEANNGPTRVSKRQRTPSQRALAQDIEPSGGGRSP